MNVLVRIRYSHALRFVPGLNWWKAANALANVSCTRSSASAGLRVIRIAAEYSWSRYCIASRSKRADCCASVSVATSTSGSGAGLAALSSINVQPTGRLGYDRPPLTPAVTGGRAAQVRAPMTPLLRIVVDHVYEQVNVSFANSIPDHVANDPLQHCLHHDRHCLLGGNRAASGDLEAVVSARDHRELPVRWELLRGTEGVAFALHDQGRHRHRLELLEPRLVRAARRVQRKRKRQEPRRTEPVRTASRGPGAGAASADDQRGADPEPTGYIDEALV